MKKVLKLSLLCVLLLVVLMTCTGCKKDKQTNEYINKPIDKFNHYLDSLRYALQCMEDRVQLRSIDKKILF